MKKLLKGQPWLFSVIAIYFFVYGWLLLATDFLPYVMDNNESFSSLWHAANLYDFGLEKSWGLADESFSPHAAAHPYVHTHQGNFPRLFAFVIYVLGARTIESQILLTTLTVGFAAIMLIYAFFSRIATPFFAAIVCMVFMTDYVLFAQWHVVTYRVWYCFLLFFCLYCTERAAETQSGKWLAGLFGGFFALLYFELVFAAFTGALCGLYAIYRCGTRFRPLISIVIAQGAGSLLGLSVVVAQGIGYLGLADFRHDLYLTFGARNDFQGSDALIEEAARFYTDNKVVFWHNFQERGAFAGLMPFVRSLTSYDWRVHTPLLASAIWVLGAGWMLSLQPRRSTGFAKAVLVAIVAAIVGVLLALPRSVLFDRGMAPIWEELHRLAGPHAVQLLVLVATGLLSARLATAGAAAMLGPDNRAQLRTVLVFLVCGGLAYSLVYFLSPGYIYSGYLQRYAPFTVFLTDVLVAAGLYVTIRCAVALAGPRFADPQVSWLRQYVHASLAGVAVLMAGFFVGYWLLVQAIYLQWLPPDHYAFVKKLARPPYRGASFVANNYTAPVAAFTGQWAYQDPVISQGFFVRKGEHLHLAGDRKYLWFADGDTNPEYRKPDYFICMVGQTMGSVVNRLMRERGVGLGEPGCSALSLVRRAQDKEAETKGIRLVEYDRAGLERTGTDWWAIVKLDWSEAPGGTVLDWTLNLRREKLAAPP